MLFLAAALSTDLAWPTTLTLTRPRTCVCIRSVLRDIVRSPVPWGSAWDGISDSCRDLISRMLEKDKAKRIRLEEALEHPWVLRDTSSTDDASSDQKDTRLDLNVVSRLQRYATYGAFKQQAMVTILKQVGGGQRSFSSQSAWKGARVRVRVRVRVAGFPKP